MCYIYCLPLGHFLFLPVRESNSLKEAFVQSSAFPRPVSSVDCQVSYSPDVVVELFNLSMFDCLVCVCVGEFKSY